VNYAETWLALSHPLVVIVIGSAFLAVWITDVRRPAFLLSLSLAYFVYATGISLQILLLPRNLAVNVSLSTALFLLAVLLLARGMTLLAGHAYRWWPVVGVLCLGVVVRLWLTLADAPPVWRFYALHVAVSAILLHGAWLARSLWQKGRTERVLYLAYLLIGLSNLPRTLLATRESLAQYGFDSGAYWLATQMSFYVLGTIFGLSLIVSIMQNRVRYEQALSETDTLTGLRNRRGFQRDFDRFSESVNLYCLMIGDIDQFKSINDRHGHQVGDEVLAAVAQIIIDNLRPSDISARIGGEEFAILLLDTHFEQGQAIAERIRHAVQTHRFGTERHDIRCTISLGLVACSAPMELQKSLRAADNLLYQAKARGRNQVAGAQL